MSMSVSGTSGLQGYMQSSLQQGAVGGNAVVGGIDGQTADVTLGTKSSEWSLGDAASTNPAPSAGGPTSPGGQPFGAGTLDELLKLQQGATGGNAAVGGIDGQTADVTLGTKSSEWSLGDAASTNPAPSSDNGTSSSGPSTQSNINLLDQLMQLQSQMLNVASPLVSSIV